MNLGATNLSVSIDVPEVKLSFSIGTGKDSRVDRTPLNIIHILRVVIKGTERSSSLTLQLEGEGREKEAY